MTEAEGLRAAESLACEIATRNFSAWQAVVSFRWMGQLGLPLATNHAADNLEQALETEAKKHAGVGAGKHGKGDDKPNHG
jgi:hypothetical protein